MPRAQPRRPAIFRPCLWLTVCAVLAPVAPAGATQVARTSLAVSATVVRPCTLVTEQLSTLAARRSALAGARTTAPDCSEGTRAAEVRWVDPPRPAPAAKPVATPDSGDPTVRILEIRF